MPTLIGKTRQGMDLNYKSSGDHTDYVGNPGTEWTQAWTSGSGSNQANRLWTKTAELAATTINFELDSGLTDDYGTALVFTKIREIWVRNQSAVATEELVLKGDFVQRAMMDGWANDPVGIVIPPGGEYRATNPIDGWAVTSDLNDTLTLDSGSDTFTYDIMLIGVQ